MFCRTAELAFIKHSTSSRKLNRISEHHKNTIFTILIIYLFNKPADFEYYTGFRIYDQFREFLSVSLSTGLTKDYNFMNKPQFSPTHEKSYNRTNIKQLPKRINTLNN